MANNNEEEETRIPIVRRVWKLVSEKTKSYLKRAPTVVFKYMEGREFHLPLKLERQYQSHSYSQFQYCLKYQILWTICFFSLLMDILTSTQAVPTALPISSVIRVLFIVKPVINLFFFCCCTTMTCYKKPFFGFLVGHFIILWINVSFILRISFIGTSNSSNWSAIIFFLLFAFLYMDWKFFFVSFVVIQSVSYAIFEVTANLIEKNIGAIFIQVSLLVFLSMAALRAAHFLQKQKRMLFLRKHNIRQCTDILTKHIEKNELLYRVLLPKEISDVVSKLPNNVKYYLDAKYTNIPFACVKVVEFERMEMFLSAKDLISVLHRLFVCFDEEIEKSTVCHRFKTLNHSFIFTTGCPGEAGGLPDNKKKKRGGQGEAASSVGSALSDQEGNYFYCAIAMCFELMEKVKKTDFGERGFRIAKLRVSCGFDVAETCFSCVIGKKQQWDVFSENLAVHLSSRNDVPHSVFVKEDILKEYDTRKIFPFTERDVLDFDVPGHGIVYAVFVEPGEDLSVNNDLRELGRKKYGRAAIQKEIIMDKRAKMIIENRRELRRLTTNLKNLRQQNRLKRKLEERKKMEEESDGSGPLLKNRENEDGEEVEEEVKGEKEEEEDDGVREKEPSSSDSSVTTSEEENEGGENEGEDEGSEDYSFSEEENEEEEEEEEEEEGEGDETGEDDVKIEEEEEEEDEEDERERRLRRLRNRGRQEDIVVNDEVTAQNLGSDSDSDEDEANAQFDQEEELDRVGFSIKEKERAIRKDIKEKKQEDKRLKDLEDKDRERTRDDTIAKLIRKDEVKNLLKLDQYIEPPKGKIRKETSVRGQEVESRTDDRWDYQVTEVSKLLQREHLPEVNLTFWNPRMKFTSPLFCCYQCCPRCPWMFFCCKIHRHWDKNYMTLNRLTFKNMFKKYYKQTRLSICLWIVGYIISLYIDILKVQFRDENRRDFGYFFKNFSVWDVIFYKYCALLPPLIVSNFLCMTSIFIVSFYSNMGLTLLSLLGTSAVFLADFYLFETYQSGVVIFCLLFFHLTIEGLPALVRSSVYGLVVFVWIVLACFQYNSAHRMSDWEGDRPNVVNLLINIFVVLCSWFFFCQIVHYRQLRHFEEYFIQGLAEKKRENLDLVKDKSSDLLASLLSEGYLPRLHELADVTSVSKFYEDVAVMCCKLSNMKEYLEIMKHDPNEIVNDLNQIFSHFDNLTDDPRLWRVKNFQGSYMVAAGVPNVSRVASQQIALCAIAMIKWLEANKKHAEFRIGIHSGPVFSGLVMRNRFQLDIFGKTIDISREFEAKSKAMMIHVSLEFTMAYCHHGNQKKYRFARRRELVDITGTIVKTYWLIGRDGFDKM